MDCGIKEFHIEVEGFHGFFTYELDALDEMAARIEAESYFDENIKTIVLFELGGCYCGKYSKDGWK